MCGIAAGRSEKFTWGKRFGAKTEQQGHESGGLTGAGRPAPSSGEAAPGFLRRAGNGDSGVRGAETCIAGSAPPCRTAAPRRCAPAPRGAGAITLAACRRMHDLAPKTSLCRNHSLAAGSCFISRGPGGVISAESPSDCLCFSLGHRPPKPTIDRSAGGGGSISCHIFRCLADMLHI